MKYQANKVPLVVIAGKDYGMGSSRDWAAKGTFLLGVKAVIAESYERIHRANLVGMGVLPLQFKANDSAASLGLTTFRNVPWNAPFYAKVGFREVPPAGCSAAVHEILADEAARGLPAGERLAMRLDLAK